MVIFIIIFLFFALLGFLLRKGKGLSLVAGYNTMSKTEKEKIDTDKLARYMSNLMFALAACCLVILCSFIFHKVAFLWIGFAAILIVIIVGVVYMNTGKRIMK